MILKAERSNTKCAHAVRIVRREDDEAAARVRRRATKLKIAAKRRTAERRTDVNAAVKRARPRVKRAHAVRIAWCEDDEAVARVQRRAGDLVIIADQQRHPDRQFLFSNWFFSQRSTSF